ncbi:protein IQ-DOMAIN 19-like [Corylus avellana]|uniref:protein IQ-DOMAIN 19-like n=1 Tax=Corylus avellana TaxID=13451 RepID=UPI001E2200DB|nr:protein IQ-DOMAIN 19-like [Corylus avellana]
MGKAGKWIRNFLLGKREQKYKKNESSSFSAEHHHHNPSIKPGSPRMKKRWSFGRAAGKRASHKFSKSLDSIDTTKLPLQATAENVDVENAAATRIQAVFRSYLARKALCALKGLVKLQALVRGHQVRKETTATLRRMHALISIQVRARVQRIQMAEEAHLVVKREPSIHRSFIQENGFRRMLRERMDTNLDENQGGLKSKSARLNHSQNERIENGGLATYYSGNLSISRREHQYKKYSFTAHNSPQHYLPTSQLNPTTASSLAFEQPDCLDLPNYMAKTESSRAKVRSQSEPKQRPNCGMRQKSKRMESTDGRSGSLENQMQRSSSRSKRFSQENYDPWFAKLYPPLTRTSNSRSDAITTSSSDSNHYKSLAYEVRNH